MRKQWTHPQLVIISQGHMEENVLAGCKSKANSSGATSSATNTNCNNLEGNCGACQPNGGKGS